MIGAVVGSYRITHELGRGGMGVVYAAEHGVLDSKAAVKMLLPTHSANAGLVSRFFNEARAVTRIKHPGIVAVFDYGHHASGSAYLIMELLEGETLARRRKRLGRLSPRQTLVLARQIAGALDAAHATGVVHRDLKPANLFLVPDPDLPSGERVKVLDFGIAKLAGDASMPGASQATREGAILGTPRYMAPEQCRGAGQVDARADIYSLGCILFELVCGEPPFVGDGHGEIIARQIYEQPPRPSQRIEGLDPGLERLILRCLAKDPGGRPASMREVVREVDELVGRAPASLDELALLPTLPAAERPTDPPLGHTLTDTRSPAVPPGRAPADEQVAASRDHALVSTTLGGSAAEIDGRPLAPARTRRRGLEVGVLTAAALAAVTVAVIAWSRAPAVGTSPAAGASPAAAPDASAPPAPADAPEVEPRLRDVTGAAPPTRAATEPPTRVTLTITSQPTGASIVRLADGVWMGQTPMTLRLMPVEGAAEFAVRLRGHRESRAVLRTDTDGIAHVVLEREPVRTTAPRADAGSPTGPPVPTPAPAGGGRRIGDGALDPFAAPAPAPGAAAKDEGAR